MLGIKSEQSKPQLPPPLAASAAAATKPVGQRKKRRTKPGSSEARPAAAAAAAAKSSPGGPADYDYDYDGGDDLDIIEQILDSRQMPGAGTVYLCRWQGKDSSYDTWEQGQPRR